MTSVNRLRGLRALLQDAVEQGTSAVERVHRATAARPFDILDHIPPIAPAARGVRLVHDATVAGVYETIRQVNRLVGVTLAAAIDVYGDEVERDGAPARAQDAQGAQRPPVTTRATRETGAPDAPDAIEAHDTTTPSNTSNVGGAGPSGSEAP
jgi:hypothetical protein